MHYQWSLLDDSKEHQSDFNRGLDQLKHRQAVYGFEDFRMLLRPRLKLRHLPLAHIRGSCALYKMPYLWPLGSAKRLLVYLMLLWTTGYHLVPSGFVITAIFPILRPSLWTWVKPIWWLHSLSLRAFLAINMGLLGHVFTSVLESGVLWKWNVCKSPHHALHKLFPKQTKDKCENLNNLRRNYKRFF